jgi:hypothetical protein
MMKLVLGTGGTNLSEMTESYEIRNFSNFKCKISNLLDPEDLVCLNSHTNFYAF